MELVAPSIRQFCCGLLFMGLLTMRLLAEDPSNVALGKNATQSSLYSLRVAYLAVDGGMGQTYSVCTHTEYNFGAWWQVDLGSFYTISSVVIYRRTDCSDCLSRMHNFRVFISTQSDSTNLNDLVFKDPRQEPPATINITVPAIIGRYVRIDLDGRADYLTLCEVQVFGTLADNFHATTTIPSSTETLNEATTNDSTTEYLTTTEPDIGTTTATPSENKTITGLLRKFTDNQTIESAAIVAGKLDKLTSDTNKTLQEEDIVSAVSVLDIIASIAARAGRVTDNITDAFFNVSSKLIDQKYTGTWQSLMDSGEEGAVDVFAVVDKYSENILAVTNFSSPTIQIVKENIAAEFGSAINRTDAIQFPSRTPETQEWATKNMIEVPFSSAVVGRRYAGVFYKNISGILPLRSKSNAIRRNVSVHAPVMSFSLEGGYSRELDPPVEITFEMFDNTLSHPVCSFWNFNASNGTGAWDTEGCSLKYRDSEIVMCSCNHLTNFALLMSAVEIKLSEAHVRGLSVLSAVGCGVSMACLVLTIAFHAVYWRIVTKGGPGRVYILISLCCALILAYILFLAGVDRTDNQVVCTVIAVLLHYIYLVVFFLMLAEGLNLALSLQFILDEWSRTIWKWLLVMAWSVPVIIVSVSMGVTKLDGYGGVDSCWLSPYTGLIWAFIAPALAIILVNLTIVIFVVTKLFRATAFKQKLDREKAKAGIRSICVLLPIMGTTWIIGVFSVTEDLIGFQYAFVVLNSLQGLFIFLLHCLFHKRIREGLQDSWRRWQQNKQHHSTSSQQGTSMATSRTATTLV